MKSWKLHRITSTQDQQMENYKSCIHSDYSIFSACNPDWHAPLTSLYANPAVGEKKLFWAYKMQLNAFC